MHSCAVKQQSPALSVGPCAPSTPAEVCLTVTRGKQPSAMDWRTIENVPVIMACRQ